MGALQGCSCMQYAYGCPYAYGHACHLAAVTASPLLMDTRCPACPTTTVSLPCPLSSYNFVSTAFSNLGERSAQALTGQVTTPAPVPMSPPPPKSGPSPSPPPPKSGPSPSPPPPSRPPPRCALLHSLGSDAMGAKHSSSPTLLPNFCCAGPALPRRRRRRRHGPRRPGSLAAAHCAAHAGDWAALHQ